MASISNPTYLTDQDKDKEQGAQKPGVQTISSGQSASTPATQGIQQQPASSGRFTNIQSYLGANANAGKQIGQAVGSGVNADIGQQQASTDKQTQAFRNAVDASKNNANAAQNFYGQSQQAVTPAATTPQPSSGVQQIPGTEQMSGVQQIGGAQAANQSLAPKIPQSNNIALPSGGNLTAAANPKMQPTSNIALPGGGNLTANSKQQPVSTIQMPGGGNVTGAAQAANPKMQPVSTLQQQAPHEVTNTTPAPAVPAQAPAPAQGFNPASITSDPALLGQYTGIRTGTTAAADQANLQAQGDRATNAAQNLADKYNTRLGQVNSNDNRFGLLKEFVGNPKTNYSSGLGSLDNAFLQADPGHTLQNLQQNLSTQQKTVVPALSKDIQNNQGQGATNVQAEKDLGAKIQDQSTKNEASYYDYLNGQMGDQNAARAQDQGWMNSQYKLLQQGNEIDPKFAQLLGLTNGERIGNTANTNSFSSLVNQGPATYTNPDQYANDQQRAYYNSLAQLAGTAAPRIGATGTDLAPVATAKDSTAGLFGQANTDAQNLMSQGQQTLGGKTYTNQQISDLMNQYGLQNYKTPDALAGMFTNANYGNVSGLVNQLTGSTGNSYAGNSFDPQYQNQQSAYNTLSNYLNSLNNAGYYNTVKIGGGKA